MLTFRTSTVTESIPKIPEESTTLNLTFLDPILE